MRPARYVALDWMLEQAANKEHESHGTNRSPLIDKINKFAGVPLGSPYCASAIKYAFHIAGIDDFGGPSAASVGFLDEWAADHNYRVTRPLKGDAFAWKIDGDDWPDHAGMVASVLSLGGLYFVLKTVEANTSSGNAGSQSEGGGWYVRKRTIRRGRIDFVRDPMLAKKDPFKKSHETPTNAEKRLQTLRNWIIKKHLAGWSWERIKGTANWREYKRRGGK